MEEGIPLEIWCMIQEYLDFKSLIRLIQTCKFLHQLTEFNIWTGRCPPPIMRMISISRDQVRIRDHLWNSDLREDSLGIPLAVVGITYIDILKCSISGSLILCNRTAMSIQNRPEFTCIIDNISYHRTTFEYTQRLVYTKIRIDEHIIRAHASYNIFNGRQEKYKIYYNMENGVGMATRKNSDSYSTSDLNEVTKYNELSVVKKQIKTTLSLYHP